LTNISGTYSFQSKVLKLALFFIPVVLFLSQIAVFYPWVEGDTYIHYVFARNIANGYGYCYNPGEPSAGSTSPLWSFILAISYKLYGDVYHTSKILSILFALGTFYLVFKLSLILFEEELVAYLAMFFFGLNPLTTEWTAIAMETMMFTFFALLLILVFIKGNLLNSTRGRVLAGILMGLTVLSRPEGSILLLIASLAHLLGREGKVLDKLRDLVLPCIFAGMVMAPYYIWLFVNVGTVLPSTDAGFLYKKIETPRFLWFYLSGEVFGILKEYFPILPFFVLGFLAYFKKRRITDYIPAVWLLFLFFFYTAVYPGTHGQRYIFPAIPLYFMFGVFGISIVRNVFSEKRFYVFFLVIIMAMHVFVQYKRFNLTKNEFDYIMNFDVPLRQQVGKWVKNNTECGSSIAAKELDQFKAKRPDYLLVEGDIYKSYPMWPDSDIAPLADNREVGTIVTIKGLDFILRHKVPIRDNFWFIYRISYGRERM